MAIRFLDEQDGKESKKGKIRFLDDNEPSSTSSQVLKNAITGAVPGGPAIAALGNKNVQDFLTETPALPIAGGTVAEVAALPAIAAGTAFGGPALGLGIRSAASSVGEATGEAFRQVGQQVTGSPNAPQTSEEAASRIGQSAVIGAVTPATGKLAGLGLTAGKRVIGKGLEKGVEALKPALTAAAGSTARIIKRFGGKLTLGQITENKFIDWLENVARGSLTGSSILEKSNKLTLGAVEKIKQKVLSKLGKTSEKFLTQEELGELLTNHLEAGRAAFKAISGKLYAAVDSKIGSAIVSPARITQKVTAFVQKSQSRVSNKIMEAVVKDVNKITSRGNMSFESAASLRSSLLERSRDLGDVAGAKEAKRLIPEFAKAIGDAIDEAGAKLSPAGQKLWRASNKFFRDNINSFDSDFLTKLISSAKDVIPLGKALTQTGNTKQLEAILGAVKRASFLTRKLPFPKAMQQIRQGFIDNLMSKGEQVATGTTNFNALASALKPNSPLRATARQIFSPRQLARLDRLITVGQEATRLPTGGAGAAGLAQITAVIGAPVATARAVQGDLKPLALVVGILGAPRFIARAVTSDSLTNLATKGLKVAVKEGTDSAAFKFLSRLAGEAATE